MVFAVCGEGTLAKVDRLDLWGTVMKLRSVG